MHFATKNGQLKRIAAYEMDTGGISIFTQLQ